MQAWCASVVCRCGMQGSMQVWCACLECMYGVLARCGVHAIINQLP